MNDLIYINKYNPNKITYKGKVIIFNTKDNKYVYKKTNKDINKLYSYLSSRNFSNYPKLIDTNIYEYINDTNYIDEQRSIDLITLLANLHNKTSYYKDVTSDKYKEIYDNILSNINYLKEQYSNYYDIFFKEIFNSPSQYLFLRNYTFINNNLSFCKTKLDEWYDLVKDKTSVRVSIIHNNISLNHYLKNNNDYFISWDNYTKDIPIIDLVKFYKKEYFNLNFNNLIKKYLSIFNLNEDEKQLFFILISLPDEITFDKNEFTSCINIRHNLDYIYKTEELIRPYYLKDEKEE